MAVMDILPLLVLSAIILLFGFATRGKIPGLFGKKPEGEPQRKTPDFNDKFIGNSGGRTQIRFIRVYSPVDLMIIRSMFDSEGIETYAEYESINSLFPGLRVPGYTDTVISIFEDKLDEAKEIAEDYLSALRNNETQRIKDMLRNLGELNIAGYAIPSNQNRMMPELLL